MNAHSKTCRKGARKEACRPRDAAATRDAILQAARGRFLRDSYDQVGLRAIAGDAGVDAALINRYFGSKEQLFAAVLDCAGNDPMDIIQGDRSDCGLRLATAMLDGSPKPRERLDIVSLITYSARTPVAGQLIRAHMEQKFILPFSAWLDDDDALDKAWMVASVMMGMALLEDVRPCLPGARERLAEVLQGIIDRPGGSPPPLT